MFPVSFIYLFSLSLQVTFVNRELVNRGAVRWIEVLWNQSSFSINWIYKGVGGWWDFVAIGNTALSSAPTPLTGLLACYLLADAAGYNHYHHHHHHWYTKQTKQKLKARDFKETNLFFFSLRLFLAYQNRGGSCWDETIFTYHLETSISTFPTLTPMSQKPAALTTTLPTNSSFTFTSYRYGIKDFSATRNVALQYIETYTSISSFYIE